MSDRKEDLEVLAGAIGAPVVLRVLLAAQSRADRHGRAGFEPGELRDITCLPKNSRTVLNMAINTPA
jgi:hypothetical protein